jgi:two-component system sensor histidine kinase/response regulator
MHDPSYKDAGNKKPMISPNAMCRWLVLLVWAACTAASAQTFVLPARNAESPTRVASQFDVLEDPTRELTLNDVRSAAHTDRFTSREDIKGSVNFGLTASAYWLRLSIRNGKDLPVDQLMEIAYPRLLTVDFYQLVNDAVVQTVHTGYARPFANRPYPNRQFVFALVAPPGETVVYLRVESKTSLEVPVSLWSTSAFKHHERIDYMVQAAYYGLAIGMILFNGLLYFSLRDKGYLFYLLFVLGSVGTNVCTSGLGTEYFWSAYPDWTTISFAAFAHVTLIGLVLFMRHMLATPTTLRPWVEKLVWTTISVNAVLFAMVFINYQIRITLLVGMLTAVVTLLIAILCALKGQRSAKIFLSAFTVLCISIIAVVLRIANLVPSNFFTVNGLTIGPAIEMVLLAFALADRFHELRQEKENAQALALASERRVVETLRASERVLEGRVAERTSELSATISRLQQSQKDLVEAEKLSSLGSLVAGVSHELNTPLGNAMITASSIDAESQELVRRVESGDIKRSTLVEGLNRLTALSDVLVRSCERAANLIRSFKKVAVDQTSEQQRSFDLLEMVNDNLATIAPSFNRHQLQLESQVPPKIMCDSYPGPLGQVLTNLLQNAAIHAFEPDTPGHLRIEGSANATHAKLVVSDNGKGMSADILKHVFDPFFTTKLGQGGSGLGLAICRNIVSGVLGGTIHAQSTEGRGSTFTIEFPLHAPHAAAAQPVSAYHALQMPVPGTDNPA